MYNGLTAADKGALLDAKARGYEVATININGFPTGLNIDLALAQIAEMESEEKPTTRNDWFTSATIEDRAKFLSRATITCPPNAKTRKTPCKQCGCVECWAEYLNSPYTEGETK